MNDTDRLWCPYFVYGTLRPNHGNSVIWRELGATCTDDGLVFVRGFQMFGRGIPYAVKTGNPGHWVWGALVHPPADELAACCLRRALDSLEGHPDGYERMICTADAPDGPVECWIYSPTRWTPTGGPEPTGDYDQMLRRERLAREGIHVQ